MCDCSSVFYCFLERLHCTHTCCYVRPYSNSESPGDTRCRHTHPRQCELKLGDIIQQTIFVLLQDGNTALIHALNDEVHSETAEALIAAGSKLNHQEKVMLGVANVCNYSPCTGHWLDGSVLCC